MIRGRWVKIEIVDLYPTNLGHCPHYNLLSHEMNLAVREYCHLSPENQAREYPEEVFLSYHRVGDYIKKLKDRLINTPINVRIELIEATSLKGVYKCIRYRIRGNRGIIFNGRKICDGNYSTDEAVERTLMEINKIGLLTYKS